MKSTKEQIADQVIDVVVQEYREEELRKRLQAVTPVTQTARACLVQFPIKGGRYGS